MGARLVLNRYVGVNRRAPVFPHGVPYHPSLLFAETTCLESLAWIFLLVKEEKDLPAGLLREKLAIIAEIAEIA